MSCCLALHSEVRDSDMMVEVVKRKTSRVGLQVVLVCAVSNEGKPLKENFPLLTPVIFFYRGTSSYGQPRERIEDSTKGEI